jgi:cation efflux system membrane fusion protein
MSRLLQSSASLTLAAAALLGSLPPASAHVGHGDEFQQQGDVRQVKANADTDALLGVLTEKPQQGPDGLSVPAAAVVDADGKPLVFVKTATTYDPVFVQTGATSGDRVRIIRGVDATEDVVVQGALSLYAESKKSQQSDTAQPAAEQAPAPAAAPPTETTAAASPVPQLNPLGIGAAAVGVLALGGFAVTRLGRRSK